MPTPEGRGAGRPLPPIGLYVILDPQLAGGRDVASIAEAVVGAGVRWIQLRDKTGTTREVLARARRLREVVGDAGGVLVVNDRVDVALAAEADGVHLGQDDLPVAEARRLAPHLLVGASTHGLAQARDAARAGASYVAVGSVFPTGSKSGFELVGLETLRLIRAEIRLPLVAIGGITAARARDVVAAGADGLAVISAIAGARDPAAEARAFLAALTTTPQAAAPAGPG